MADKHIRHYNGLDNEERKVNGSQSFNTPVVYRNIDAKTKKISCGVYKTRNARQKENKETVDCDSSVTAASRRHSSEQVIAL